MKLNEIAFPINTKDTFLYFLVIFVYLQFLKNGIVFQTGGVDDESIKEISKLTHKVNDQRQEIEELKKVLAEEYKASDRSSEAIINQKQRIESLNHTVNEQNQTITNQRQDITTLENQIQAKNDTITKLKRRFMGIDGRKRLFLTENKWLHLQIKKSHLINQGHYQYAGMAAMGVGIIVTGSYLLSKCF